VRAELLERLGEPDAAAAEFRRAAELPGNEAEGRALRARADGVAETGLLG
jgi:predicted RNA polymerase sigma factor